MDVVETKEEVKPIMEDEQQVIEFDMKEFTPDNITKLATNEVFVFGSNAEGRHGLGAAKLAKDKFGAIYGQAEGIQGQSYAVITKKDFRQPKSSTLQEIGKGLQDMLLYAKANPNKKFLVTKLGSSLAGYSIEEIKSLFVQLRNIIPSNVVLPKEYEVREEDFSPKLTNLQEARLAQLPDNIRNNPDVINAAINMNQEEFKEIVEQIKKCN